MCLGFPQGVNVVVARQACLAQDHWISVIKFGNWLPGSRRMAAIAGVRCGQVLARDRQLASGIGAVVAGNACRRANVGVIESGLPRGE
jgi:hypothetical protein